MHNLWAGSLPAAALGKIMSRQGANTNEQYGIKNRSKRDQFRGTFLAEECGSAASHSLARDVNGGLRPPAAR